MKLIITEAQARFLEQDWKTNAKNIAGEKLRKASQWGAEKAANVVTDKGPEVANWAMQQQSGGEAPIELSPEMAARFNDINIEKDAPNLHKFLSSLKTPSAATGAAEIFKLPGMAASVKDMIHPLGHKVKINSGYGPRDVKDEPKASKNHTAVDFEAASGSPVYAPLDGVVVRAEDTSPNGDRCGGHIRIKHNDMLETKYCHLKQWKVKKGNKVKKGEVIGYTGGGPKDPGRGVSTGPHLHYAIVVNGKEVDPLTIQTGLA